MGFRLMMLPALLLALAGCAAPPAPTPPARPMRIVSLDYCADQYLLKLVDRDRILAVSPHAASDFSYMRAAARGVATVAPRVEDVLVLRPDLVVRSYGGGPGTEALLARAGVPVLQLGYADTIAGIRRELLNTAARLDEASRGARLAAEMDRRLASLRRPAATATALYATPGGVTTGSGTLIDEMLRAAGYRNFQEREAGWHPLPLERLAYRSPDIVAAASFGAASGPRDGWSAAHHPIMRALFAARPVAALEGAWTTCGGWFLLDAVEALARARQ